MPNNIILKKSSVVDKVPLPGDLQFGELALNFADGNLFYKNSANTISTIASNKFVSVIGNVTGSNVTGTVSLNTAGNINFTNAEASDTAKIYANVSGATTSLVMEVSDDLATDRIVLRHRYFATANTVDMLSAQLSGNTEANVTITGNLIATNQVIATGNVTGGNITTAGLISATGNITGGNLRTGGQVSATGTITGGNLNVSGNAAAGILLNVTDTAPAGSSKAFNIASGTNGLAVVANITSGSYNSLQSTGDIALLASGANIGNVGFSIIPWAGANSGIRINTVSNVTSITLAATTVSITGATVGTGNITGGNILTAGLISATGNVTGGNITTAGIANVATLEVTALANVKATTAATSTTTGAIRTAGGLGVAGNAYVGGALVATTKSFAIQHPDKLDKILFHGCLEGPEHAVYTRGRCTTDTIVLPDYWKNLVDSDSITVHLTPVNQCDTAKVVAVTQSHIVIQGQPTVDCFYIIHARRKDVPALDIEVSGSIQDLYRDRNL